MSGQAEAVQWVDANTKMILSKCRKFKAYSPYDLVDFLQEARIAAICAANMFPVGSDKFVGAFRKNFLFSASRMATDPCFAAMINGEPVEQIIPYRINDPAATKMTDKRKRGRKYWVGSDEYLHPFGFLEFDEGVHSPVNRSSMQSSIEYFESPPVDIHRTMIALSRHLLKNQVDVWITVLGLSGTGGTLSYAEAGIKLGRGKGDVFKIFDNACRRIKRLIDKGEIKAASFPKMRLVSVPCCTPTASSSNPPRKTTTLPKPIDQNQRKAA